jgi:phytanoyl-CoA hydroxylase
MNFYSNFFNENGYCIIPNVIPTHVLDLANSKVNEFFRRNFNLLNENNLLVNGMFQRVVNFHCSINSLKDIFYYSVTAGSSICDVSSPSTLYTSLYFEFGSEQPFHRDTPYFYSGINNGYMGIWAALDDADSENGALVVIKKSHLLPEPDLDLLKNKFFPNSPVPPSSTPLFNAYNNELMNIAIKNNLEIITCKVNRGDVIFWNASTLHGGLNHINLQKTRRSFVMHVTPKDMPIHSMDYFFDKSKKIISTPLDYENFRGRLILKGNAVDFAHKKSFNIDQLGIY